MERQSFVIRHSSFVMRPTLTQTEAVQLTRRLYHLTASARELPSDRDQNFLLTAASGKRFVLKISHAAEQRAILDFQNRAMAHLTARLSATAFPRVIPTVTGEEIFSLQHKEQRRLVRLLSYLPGLPLAKVKPHSAELLRELGTFLGRMDTALVNFTHPAMRRTLQWDLQHAARTIRAHIQDIGNSDRREIVKRFLHQFEARILPALPDLPASVIHGDANDYNVLTQDNRISGLIDFGDMVYTPTVFEVAIAAAYAMLGKDDPLAAAAHVIAGYQQAKPLSQIELDVLPVAITARLCVSVTLSAYQQKLEPHNAYLRISEAPAWAVLERVSR